MSERDTRRPLSHEEPPETQVWFSVCVKCDWESEYFDTADETPSECAECGADVDRHTNFT